MSGARPHMCVLRDAPFFAPYVHYVPLFSVDFHQLTRFLLRMLNTGYSVQEIIEYFKTYVPVKERIARKFKEYKELTEKLKNGKEIFFIVWS